MLNFINNKLIYFERSSTMIKRLLSLFFDRTPTPKSFEIQSMDSLERCNTTFKNSTLETFNWLNRSSLCFPVHGDNVKIILEPNMFYETLLKKSINAKYRINLSSLYLGIGDLEKRLIQAIHENLKSNQQLKVNILLDFTRGTRGQINSKSLLLPLLQTSPNCSLSLYHTPSLRGFKKRFAPPKWNELIGLQHMKVYLFDDTVMISGANLSNDYFTNRQDRYILIQDQNLSNFYSNLLAKVQEFSLQVEKTGTVSLHPTWTLLPYECDKSQFIIEVQQRIRNFFNENIEIQYNSVGNIKDADTWIYPLIEMGQLGIHHDSIATKSILSNSLSESKLNLATGYFNLTSDYMDTITNKCLAKCKLLMAHPNANGFLGSSFPAGGIPAAYSLIALKFYNNLIKAKQNKRVNLFEYEKKNWTYHAKGLWYYLPNSELPNLTLIGSSNFGERSVNRDLETQICLVTTNRNLQHHMQVECDHLYSMGSTAENELVKRIIPRWVKGVVFFFRNFF